MKKGCELIAQNLKNVKITSIGRGFLNSVRIDFNGEVIRREREKINKCLKENKMKAIWGKTAVIIK